MKITNSPALKCALAGFALGTGFAVLFTTFGVSLLDLSRGWARLFFYPGYLVGHHTFEIIGYSAAVSLACLTVGVVYSAIASAVAGVLELIRVLLRIPGVAVGDATHV
jgi:hypothetical protein